MKTWAYVFFEPRPNFIGTLTPAEGAAFGGHQVYTDDLLAKGVVKFKGAALTGKIGIVVFEAQDEEGAKVMYESDPLVKANMVISELHPFAIMGMAAV